MNQNRFVIGEQSLEAVAAIAEDVDFAPGLLDQRAQSLDKFGQGLGLIEGLAAADCDAGGAAGDPIPADVKHRTQREFGAALRVPRIAGRAAMASDAAALKPQPNAWAR